MRFHCEPCGTLFRTKRTLAQHDKRKHTIKETQEVLGLVNFHNDSGIGIDAMQVEYIPFVCPVLSC